ncbi:MAG: 16S rRNA (uracil(1498)-N(3))-methyltransferase [Candidatus Omnitrophica bacterium]|nr:16S rRNA (uracil(1498)-N(3))-methyltransferase [Candidatus Omnitrophota bacterium]
MHCFYCVHLSPHREQLIIDDPDEVHHLARVLRVRPGDEVELVNGRGVWGRARCLKIAKQTVEVVLLQCQETPVFNSVRTVLACALPKRARFDDIIEKCTELGVDEIVPLITERTEAAPNQEALLRMAARFNKVVLSASKQCKRLWFPVVYSPMLFSQAVDVFAIDGNALYFPWLAGERKLLKDAMGQSSDKILKARVFFIGPEGDFTAAEAAYAVGKGAVPVSLGATVLRVETAAIAVAAYAHFITGGSS